MKKPFSHAVLHMLGDCEDCGHSAVYHVPLMGCIKCGCDEFH